MLLLKTADPQVIRDLVEQGIVESAGFTPTDLVVIPLPVQTIGDATAAFTMKFDTEFGTFEGHLLFFAQGRIGVEVAVTGVEGRIAVSDTMSLARFISQKITETSR